MSEGLAAISVFGVGVTDVGDVLEVPEATGVFVAAGKIVAELAEPPDADESVRSDVKTVPAPGENEPEPPWDVPPVPPPFAESSAGADETVMKFTSGEGS